MRLYLFRKSPKAGSQICKTVSPRGADYMIVIGVGEVLLLQLLLLVRGVYLACFLGMPISVGAAEGLF